MIDFITIALGFIGFTFMVFSIGLICGIGFTHYLIKKDPNGPTATTFKHYMGVDI